jgi:uncharacterized protein DUF2793
MDTSSNLKLPFIAAAQAQKHVTHNAAILALDTMVQLSVLDRDLTAPPTAPLAGDRYIVAGGATGAWENKDWQIAAWQDGAWVFYPATTGWLAWVEDEELLSAWDGGAWVQASSGGLLSVPMMGVNSTPDSTNRLSTSSPSTLLNHDGASHQVKINKNSDADTASLLYQTNWSGRAEMGTTGDDDWHVKVSADGSLWKEALHVSKEDGAVTVSQEMVLPDGVKIANHGTTDSGGVEIEAGGTYGKVALTLQSAGLVTGALFEQRSLLGSGLDVLDFAFKTLSEQMSLRIESRAEYTFTGNTPEWQVNDYSQAPTLSNLLAVSPNQCLVQMPMGLKSYTIATLPSAVATSAGSLAYVSDAAGGAVPAFCDGANWRNITDRAIVV